MGARDFGTLYETFCKSVTEWGDRPAYGAPPRAGRTYHPDGIEYPNAETSAAAEAFKIKYAAAEIEAVLTVHDKVKQIAVIAVPDELREEEIMACVVPRSQTDANEQLATELFELTLGNLAYFKAPGWFIFMDDLPTTSTQKIQKVNIFPTGVDPRKQHGVIDFRALKKKPVRDARGDPEPAELLQSAVTHSRKSLGETK